MDITYKIEFHNDWHCGSGLSAGADVDLLVIKDKQKLPFVPGKTMKGLVKEAMIDILTFKKNNQKDTIIEKLLGKANEKHADIKEEIESTKEEAESIKQGCLFFTNAELDEATANLILEEETTEFLYRDIASTAINDKGVAMKHSLRKLQVTIPCTLFGIIKNTPAENVELIEQSLKYIKRLGQNRNRGLGRCDITIIEKGGLS